MIFVTGGTGLLGNSVVRELCARGLKTRVLCRPGASSIPFDGLPVEFTEGDLSQPHLLDAAIADCTAVVHCAAMIHVGWQRLEQSRQVNVEGTRAIVDACLRHGCRMIHISTVDTLPAARSQSEPIDERAEGGLPQVPCTYVVSKTEAEQLVREACQQRGLDAVILNPGFMLGPYDWKPSSGRMFLQVVKAPMIAAPWGGCSLCDARQVARACVNAIERGQAGERYILAGENIGYRELWKRMRRIAGRPKHVFSLRKRITWIGAAIDWFHRNLPVAEGDVNGASIGMGILNHYYDSSKAQRELGYNPQMSDAAMTEIWNWLKTQHG
jgi:dihydroflavonol-4-reductase